MSLFPDDITRLATSVLIECRSRGFKIVTAESCTGGLIAAALTEIAGSSDVVDRGFVTYSNESKIAMLGVTAQSLEAHGAVSKEVALEMAAGAIAKSEADVAIAVTGVAGPGGGTAQKSVGLVHVAVAGVTGTLHFAYNFGDIGRTEVRLETVRAALQMILKALNG